MTATVATIPAATFETTSPPAITGSVRTWLRLEGLAAFVAGILIFGLSSGNWFLLVPLLLLPDVSMAGYLAGPRVGAFTYNLAHTWAPGFIVLGVGAWLATPAILVLAGVLIAHVGMDRLAGYGLKLPSSFHDTHLGRIGCSKA